MKRKVFSKSMIFAFIIATIGYLINVAAREFNIFKSIKNFISNMGNFISYIGNILNNIWTSICNIKDIEAITATIILLGIYMTIYSLFTKFKMFKSNIVFGIHVLIIGMLVAGDPPIYLGDIVLYISFFMIAYGIVNFIPTKYKVRKDTNKFIVKIFNLLPKYTEEELEKINKEDRYIDYCGIIGVALFTIFILVALVL